MLKVADPVLSASPVASTPQMPSMGSFQEFYWLLEQLCSFSFVLLAEVEGETTVEDWQRAADLVQARYPLLSVSIRKENGKRPYFVPNPEPIRVRVVPMSSISSLTDEMEQEQRNPFGDGSGVLTRIKLIHSRERSAVLLTTHHSLGDGRSNLLVMQDLLAAAAGEPIGPRLPPGPTGDQVLGFKEVPYKRKLPAGTKFSIVPDLFARSGRVRIRRLQLDREETSTLVQRAKAEGTTVQGALVAAFVMAGRHYSKAWRTSSVRCLNTMDLRSMMHLPMTSGVLLAGHHAVYEASQSLPFWEFARWIKNDLRKARTPEGALASLGSIRNILSEERTPEQFQTILNAGPSINLIVNNNGIYNSRTDFEGLKLRSLSYAGPVIAEGPQNISAITVDGILDLTHVSMNPFPDFLEEARDLLVTFSHEAREPAGAGLRG
ncbi:phthiocerol/phthiodiolone dimycocerosyl transferase family protein [Terriglobus saanensis]|uniref:Phthiocerol/phthiodiolone dimycocerosyl transferase n=1 Tax=Terriglobus saanensis (strain ATCC BAA-1853 / DSM 23119 / SP1PR4) TaxID=401053 RepID=E8V5B8_TERSS|nr:condensation domain-containing protein [Terriglobus saanensis]ADV84877.1 condensation domain protein [Terriglobus saanensis SP1PR4]